MPAHLHGLAIGGHVLVFRVAGLSTLWIPCMPLNIEPQTINPQVRNQCQVGTRRVSGDIHAIFQGPSHSFAAAFLGARPSPVGDIAIWTHNQVENAQQHGNFWHAGEISRIAIIFSQMLD